jgi:hypothetical protein
MCDDCQREVVMGYGLVEPAEDGLALPDCVPLLLYYLLRWQSFAHGAVSSMTCEHITVQGQGLP